MALVLTLRPGQGFKLDSDEYTVADVRSSQDFTLRTPKGELVKVGPSKWQELVPNRAWVMASDSRRLGSKEVGVMIEAPSFNVLRCVY